MGRSRHSKRKIPVTVSHPAGSKTKSKLLPASASSSSTRGVIRRFHVLLKRQMQLKSKACSGKRPSDVTEELAKIEQQLDALGGLEKYQAMSSIGQSAEKGGGSERILISWLKELRHERQSVLRLLDVGALKHDNYEAASFVNATPMDLHSRHPKIIEQDFMTLKTNPHLSKEWDVISLSLVLNFVPEARQRGQMLRLAHELVCADGLLFVVLPLPCVLNSRYLTVPHFVSLMDCVGFEMVKERWKPSGKVAYWLFRKSGRVEDRSRPHSKTKDFSKKVALREGANRNNFCILL